MLKRITLLLAVLLIAGGAAFAQNTLTGLSPKDARTMGMGGAFRTFGYGYMSLYGNPAGLAYNRISVTLADIGAWAYLKPNQKNLEAINTVLENPDDTATMTGLLEDLITENGLGAGASIGASWTGKGFGAGVTIVTDEVLAGTTLLGANMTSRTEANGVVGLAFPFRMGPVTLKVGADARAFYRIEALGGSWSARDILIPILSDPNADFMQILGDQPIAAGMGFAADVGAIMELGPFMLGATYRNIGFGITLDETKKLKDVLDGNLPMGGTTAYTLKDELSAGLGFRWENRVLSPSIYAEVTDIIPIISDLNAAWGRMHVGGELKLFNFLAARAGLNQGYFTVGAGIDFLIIEVDAAFFTEELGYSPGDFGRSGIALEIALRL